MAGQDMTWKDALRQRGLATAGPTFRHDLSSVSVSSIAQQFYCEQKVEQEYTRGEIPSEVKDTGTELHEEILAMQRVNVEDLIVHIETAPIVTASFGLRARVGELQVVGVPDAVVFEKSKPTWLIELKTTRGDHTRLWREQLLQAKIYGLLLDRMGFDCSSLRLVMVKMRQDGSLEGEQKRVMLNLIRVALLKNRTQSLEQAYALKFFINPHDPLDAENSVLWAQDYWLQRRPPVPTKKPSKCMSCEYSDVCPDSLRK